MLSCLFDAFPCLSRDYSSGRFKWIPPTSKVDIWARVQTVKAEFFPSIVGLQRVPVSPLSTKPQDPTSETLRPLVPKWCPVWPAIRQRSPDGGRCLADSA